MSLITQLRKENEELRAALQAELAKSGPGQGVVAKKKNKWISERDVMVAPDPNYAAPNPGWYATTIATDTVGPNVNFTVRVQADANGRLAYTRVDGGR